MAEGRVSCTSNLPATPVTKISPADPMIRKGLRTLITLKATGAAPTTTPSRRRRWLGAQRAAPRGQQRGGSAEAVATRLDREDGEEMARGEGRTMSRRRVQVEAGLARAMEWKARRRMRSRGCWIRGCRRLLISSLSRIVIKGWIICRG